MPDCGMTTHPHDEAHDPLPMPVRLYRDTLLAAVRVLNRVEPDERGATRQDLATIAGTTPDWMTQRDRVHLALRAIDDAVELLAAIEQDIPGLDGHDPRYDRPPSWAGPMS